MIAHDLNAVAFPKLTDEQMSGLERCSAATLKRYRDGERLFQAGDRDFGFFVVKSGKVEIIDESGDAPKTVTVHGPGGFTGDVSHLTGKRRWSAPSRAGIARSTRLLGTACAR